MKLRDFMMSMDKVKTAIEKSANECFTQDTESTDPKVEVDMSFCTQMSDDDGNVVAKLDHARKLGSIRVILFNDFCSTLYGMKKFLEEMDVKPKEQGAPFPTETMMLDYGEDGKPIIELFLDAERMFEKFG